jgi:hypothetical protein
MKLGDVDSARGNINGALADAGESAILYRELVRTDPREDRWRDNLGWALGKLAAAKVATGDRASALALWAEVLGIRRALAASDPMSARAKDNVAWALVEWPASRRRGDTSALSPTSAAGGCAPALALDRATTTG